jgi:hypothetical protein
VLDLAGDLDAALTGVFAVLVDPSGLGSGPVGVGRVVGELRLGQPPVHDDLVPVDDHFGWLGEPALRQCAGDPRRRAVGGWGL